MQFLGWSGGRGPCEQVFRQEHDRRLHPSHVPVRPGRGDSRKHTGPPLLPHLVQLAPDAQSLAWAPVPSCQVSGPDRRGAAQDQAGAALGQRGGGSCCGLDRGQHQLPAAPPPQQERPIPVQVLWQWHGRGEGAADARRDPPAHPPPPPPPPLAWPQQQTALGVWSTTG